MLPGHPCTNHTTACDGRRFRFGQICSLTAVFLPHLLPAPQVYGFTLDQQIGEFVLSHDNIRVPESGKIYSFNEGNYAMWSDGLKKYMDSLKTGGKAQDDKPYSARYIGSLVGDFHRTLLYGGIYGARCGQPVSRTQHAQHGFVPAARPQPLPLTSRAWGAPPQATRVTRRTSTGSSASCTSAHRCPSSPSRPAARRALRAAPRCPEAAPRIPPAAAVRAPRRCGT